MLKPQALQPGDTIGLIAPSRWVDDALVQATVQVIEANGFKAKLSPQLLLREGQLGGPDDARAAALHDMFTDAGVQAILCARGGTGAFRMAKHLDIDLIKRNPKIFCGFSDITTLHIILGQAGLVTFHGPMGWSFSHTPDPAMVPDFFEVLTGKKSEWSFNSGKTLSEGRAEGVLIGGNISLLRNLIGTQYDWQTTGAILFIEEVSDDLYKLDHKLWQFRESGKLALVKGVMVGEMVDISDANPDDRDECLRGSYGRDWETLLREYLPPNVPVVMDVPLGHGKMLITLPLGIRARLHADASGSKLTLAESAFG